MIQLRDEIIKALADMQAKSALRVWLPADERTINYNVLDTARAICAGLGDDWDTPTCNSLIRLIAKLIIKAHQWGAPLADLNDCTATLGKQMDDALEQRGE